MIICHMTYRSISSARDILKLISIIPPIGTLSLPVVNSNTCFWVVLGKLRTTSQKYLEEKNSQTSDKERTSGNKQCQHRKTSCCLYKETSSQNTT